MCGENSFDLFRPEEVRNVGLWAKEEIIAYLEILKKRQRHQVVFPLPKLDSELCVSTAITNFYRFVGSILIFIKIKIINQAQYTDSN